MRIEQYDIDGQALSIPIPETYRDCFLLIKSDRFRISGRKESTASVILNTLKPFKSSTLFWLRLAAYRGIFYPFCKWMYKRASRRDCIQIPSSTKIGYGFYLGHAICIVVNGLTVIGNNVNLSQFVNIGTNKKTPAVIGDGAYIGPQCCIIEDVRIGRNSSIGAGSVVTKSIPENATAVGSPAKVLNYDNPGRFILNPYLF